MRELFVVIIKILSCLLLSSISCIFISVAIVFVYGQQSGWSILQGIILDNSNDLQLAQPAAADAESVIWGKLNIFFTHNAFVHTVLNSILNHLQLIEQMMQMLLITSIFAIHLLIIRLYLLCHWSFLFLVLGLVGFVDGLTQRSIRRANAGHESALIYHQAKSFALGSLIIGMVASLILPVKIKQIEWVVIISAVLFGFAIQIAARSFKKYL